MKNEQQLIEVYVFRKSDGKSVLGANVVLGGNRGSKKTDKDGKAVFMLPSNVSTIDIYVNGTTQYSGYISNLPQPFIVKI